MRRKPATWHHDNAFRHCSTAMASEGSTGHSPASFSPDLAISAAFHSRNWEGRAEKVKKAQQASPMASAIWNFNSPAVSIPSRIRAVKKESSWRAQRRFCGLLPPPGLPGPGCSWPRYGLRRPAGLRSPCLPMTEEG